MKAWPNPLISLAEQRGMFFPWSAVLFAVGVGVYFWSPVEPGPGEYLALSLLAGALCVAAFVLPTLLRPVFLGGLFVVLGGLVAGGHTWLDRAPVLGFRYYGPVEGRVVAVDRSQSNKIRLTLDQVVLERMAPDVTPKRVRISLHGAADPFDTPEQFAPGPGDHIALTANISPPQGPAEPGGFDFRRYAWFRHLGAVGYTRTPVMRMGPDRVSGFSLHLMKVRVRLSDFVRTHIPGTRGAFAAAITSGDRAAIPQATLDALRASNLAHLLAISGLHMGLLTGFIFAALRFAMALVPMIALRLPVKKIAAVGAIITGAGYLALSGGNVSTVRAFIMVTVMFVAVLTGRRALTLNAVALAALIVLMIEPESLVGPGFQMSFAATTALVFVFGTLRGAENQWLPRWLRPVFAVVLSSFVAGAATAPIAAAHFNQVAQFGLLANVLSVPVMGAIVVPAAVMAFLLAPFGLGFLGFWVMELGIGWILGVAEWVAGLEGAVWKVVTPPPVVLPLFCLGALLGILWRGRLRGAGMVPVVLALFLWIGAARPLLLVADSGRLMGLMTQAGRVLNKPRGDGFVARSWLENDGDPVGQREAAARVGFEELAGTPFTELGGQKIFVLTGRGAAARFLEICQGQALVIYAGERPEVDGQCRLIGTRELRASGAMAFWPGRDGSIEIRTVADLSGRRPWVPQQR